MPPITSLGQITGDAAQINWLDPNRKIEQSNPFYILLLGDGFAENDKTRFETFIKKLEIEFFHIPPFNYCSPYIVLLYCFLPSAVSGMAGLPDEPNGTWRRVFRLFVDGDKLRPKDDAHVLQVVFRLKLHMI